MRYIHTRYAAFFLVVLCLSGPLTGQTAENRSAALSEMETAIAENPTLPVVLTYAYENNPDIQAAKAMWEAAVAEYGIRISLPDPMVTATYFPSPIETRLGPQDWNAAISQSIPFPGKLAQKGRIAESGAKIFELKTNQVVRDVSISVRESFYELGYIRTARAIASRNRALLARMRTISETAHARDRATFYDVSRARAQEGQLSYDELLLEDLEAVETARLNSLLGRAPDAPIGRLQETPTPLLAVSLEDIYRLAETAREEIRIADLKISRADQRLGLARLQRLPDFKIGLTYSGIGRPDVARPPQGAGDDALGIQFGITVPLWFSKNNAQIDRARAEKRAAEAKRKNLLNQTRSQVRALFFKVQNSMRLIRLYEQDLMPQAVHAMEIAETWYREDQASLADFIETQATFYNFQLALARSRADYGQNLARLERLAGRGLTRPLPAGLRLPE